MSESLQVLDTARASDRQRHEAITRIRHAHREGRIQDAEATARLRRAGLAVTKADLAYLTSDLGEWEKAYPLRVMAVLSSLLTLVAAWVPVFVVGRWWLALAVPVTVIAAYVILALPEFLV